jgi:putative colanic acid biosynthesis UDP-glucose lipid carrier transferase
MVGPRPHAIAVNEQYRKLIPGYMLRHKIKPGITGWAQVNGHRGGDDLEAMRKRVEFDMDYLKNWSLALDLSIIFRTVIIVWRDTRAY